MDKKLLFLALVIIVLTIGSAVNAVPDQTCEKGTVNAGYLDNSGKFKVNNTFEKTEDISAKYKNERYCRNPGNKMVDVYFVQNAKWNAGDSISESDILHSTSVRLSDLCSKNGAVVWEANTDPGQYDMFLDVSNCDIIREFNPEADCSRIEKVYNPCMGDAVDNKRRVIGFEILPEADTAGLLSLGLVGMIGYVTVRKR